MLKQVWYSFEDMLNNKLVYLIYFIQILISLILIGAAFNTITNLQSYQKKLIMVMEDQKEGIYVPFDLTSREKAQEIINGGGDMLNRLQDLYSFIKGFPSVKTYTANTTSSVRLGHSSLDASFYNRYKDLNMLEIDDKYQTYFNLKTIQGRVFTDQDFLSTADEIPLILGYDFQKYYDLNDVIVDESGKTYRVVGFLDKSFYYVNPLEGETVFLLDKMFIIPFRSLKADCSEFHSAILSTFVITNNPAGLRAIQSKSNSLRLFNLNFRSFSEQLEYLLGSTRRQMISWGVMVSGILFFAMTSFVSSLLQFIETHTKEFAVHLLCGARVYSIIQRVTFQVFSLVLVSDFVMILIHKFNAVCLLTVASSWIVGLLIVVYPVYKLSKTPINTLLKRSQ